MPDTKQVTTSDAERAAKSLDWLADRHEGGDEPFAREVRQYSVRGAEVIRALVAERDRLLRERA